ncbi:MAG: transporter substrate-binding domain-containing protein, partial [Methanomicrobiales archaeon]|nr:transporter substrate-binding domain-containing protein [Methanomicrobiales archaeon]
MLLPKHGVFLFCVLMTGALLVSGCLTQPPDGGVPTTTPGPILTYYTEQMPPYNYEENGTLKGIAVDLLEAITEKMGTKVSRNQVHLVPWTEGYQAALTGNHTVLFTAARLPAREPLFKWAGPVYSYTNVLFARPDREIVITSATDLNQYSIGVIVDDVAVQQLLDAGLNRSRLVYETNASVLVARLESGEIDLWGYTEAAGRYFARQRSGNASSVKVVYRLPELQGYYIFSRDIPDATVQSFQQALNSLKQEKAAGITAYERIVQRYIPLLGMQPPRMTPDDLVAFVENASAYANAVGDREALAEFQKKDGQFCVGTVYIYAYDYNYTLLAHPYEPDLVGTNRRNWTDIRG